MIRSLQWRTAACLGIALLAGRPLQAQDSDRPVGQNPVGQKVASFILPGQDGKQIGLADFQSTDVVVLFTMVGSCDAQNTMIYG